MKLEFLYTIPKTVRIIILAFFTLIMVRITWPIVQVILNLQYANPIFLIVANLIYIIIILFVTWISIGMEMLKNPNEEENMVK